MKDFLFEIGFRFGQIIAIILLALFYGLIFLLVLGGMALFLITSPIWIIIAIILDSIKKKRK